MLSTQPQVGHRASGQPGAMGRNTVGIVCPVTIRDRRMEGVRALYLPSSSFNLTDLNWAVDAVLIFLLLSNLLPSRQKEKAE